MADRDQIAQSNLSDADRQVASSSHSIVALPAGQLASKALVPTASSFARSVQQGFTSASLSTSALATCCSLAAQTETDLDEDYNKLHVAYIDAGVGYHCSSTLVKAQSLDVARRKLENKLCRLTLAQIIHLRMKRTLLEQQLCLRMAPQSLVAYIEAACYDETPLKVAIKGDSLSHCTTTTDPHGGAGSTETEMATALQQLDGNARLGSMSTKILQTREMYAMMIQVHGQFIKILGDTVCPLQAVESTSGECIREALVRNSSTSIWSRQFGWTSRCATTDQAGGNLRAERGLSEARGQHWPTLWVPCDVHISTNAMRSTYDSLMATHVTGILSTALSLRHSSSLQLFRASLRDIIASRLKILEGVPGPSVVAYRKAMLKVFTATSSTVPQRVLLATLPNGNWANHDAVEWYMPLGTPRERVDGSRVSAMLEAGLCYCLIGSKPHLWQRHRWLGSEIAVEELGKLQMVHGLLVPVYTRFLERFSSTRMVPNVGACAVGSGPLPIEAGADDVEPTDHDAGQAEQWTANASSQPRSVPGQFGR